MHGWIHDDESGDLYNTEGELREYAELEMLLVNSMLGEYPDDADATGVLVVATHALDIAVEDSCCPPPGFGLLRLLDRAPEDLVVKLGVDLDILGPTDGWVGEPGPAERVFRIFAGREVELLSTLAHPDLVALADACGLNSSTDAGLRAQLEAWMIEHPAAHDEPPPEDGW